jgi:acyl-CoA thioesterase
MVVAKLHDDTVLSNRGDGTYDAVLSDRWMVPSGPNGGYLAALIVRAAVAASGGLTPRALNVHFLSGLPLGPATIETTILRAGRSVTTIDVVLAAGERSIVGRASLGPPRDGIDFCDVAMPDVAGPEDLSSEQWPEDDDSSVHMRYDMRFARGGAHEFDHDDAEAIGWLRTDDAASVDHIVLAALTDSWPPPVARRQRSGVGAPTMDLTIHFRDPLTKPIDDFVLVHSRTRMARDGFADLDTDVWSRDGRLLATARQLGLLVPRPIPSSTD